MKHTFFTFLIWIFPTISISSQSCSQFIAGAFNALCKNDTTGFMLGLNQYQEHCKDSDLIIITCLLKCEIYEQNADFENAIKSATDALRLYKKPESIGDIPDSCDNKYTFFNQAFWISDYNLILKLADLHSKKRAFPEALNYLNSIDRNRIFGYSGCLNVQIQFETAIACQYAKCYLRMGDTTEAINYLVDYCLFNEGSVSHNELALLKSLLEQKYSKKEIYDEISKSISNARDGEKDQYGFSRVDYRLFGRKIPFLYYNLAEFKEFIRQNENIRFLQL